MHLHLLLAHLNRRYRYILLLSVLFPVLLMVSQYHHNEYHFGIYNSCFHDSNPLATFKQTEKYSVAFPFSLYFPSHLLNFLLILLSRHCSILLYGSLQVVLHFHVLLHHTFSDQRYPAHQPALFHTICICDPKFRSEIYFTDTALNTLLYSLIG